MSRISWAVDRQQLNGEQDSVPVSKGASFKLLCFAMAWPVAKRLSPCSQLARREGGKTPGSCER